MTSPPEIRELIVQEDSERRHEREDKNMLRTYKVQQDISTGFEGL